MRNSGFTWSAARTWGESLHAPSGIAGSMAAFGWMYGLPRKNARPVPNSISPMPTAMSFTRGRLHTRPWSSPRARPAPPAASTPSHGLPVPCDTA